jgi:glycosyltransferase involved in cell wall biosynthesis
MRVLVLATSYPRSREDVAGHFVADQVDQLRAAGVDVTVVSPHDFRHYGIAYGHGIVQNLRAKPWLVPLLPAFVTGYARAARRAARDVDLVHAHWIPSGAAALSTGKPYVLQVWGTDVELARRVPAIARPVIRNADLVIAASPFLAEAARRLGAADVAIVPSAVDVPPRVVEPDEPPHVLYLGRLSPEKGILDFVEATDGLARVIVGDGPLRDRVPDGVGAVPPTQVGEWYDRAAVVCVPSHREGYGYTAREAMAHGRAVVATAVGGLVDAVDDGVTGLVVQPGDPPALRAALERLLADGELRDRLGKAARAYAERHLTARAATAALLAAYHQAGVRDRGVHR